MRRTGVGCGLVGESGSCGKAMASPHGKFGKGGGLMRLAIFDVTHWHFPLYLPAITEAGIEVVGVCDREQHTGARVADTLKCPLLTCEQLMEREFDFALVFSRHSEMASVAKALIARRRPFLIEKPCGLTAASVRHLDKLAKSAGVFVTVPLILRVSDFMQRIRLPAAGYRHMAFRFIVGPISRYEASGNSWMLSSATAGGGSAINVGVHFYDLASALTQSEVATVCGHTRKFRADIDVEEWASFTLTMKSGQTALVQTGYLYPTTPDDQREFSFSLAHENAFLQGYSDQIAIKRVDGAMSREKVEYNTDHFYPVFLRDALARLKAGAPPGIGLDDAERAVAVVEAGYRSAEQGGRPVVVAVRE